MATTNPVPDFEVIRSLSLVDQVRDQILRALVRGELKPGQRLIENELAERMGVSRGPIREAARLLEQRGLLVFQPRRGFVVRELEEKAIDDLYEFRLCIESYAIGHLARHATPKDIVALRRRIDAMRPLAKRERLIDLFEALLQFHGLLCELSRNRRIARAFEDIAIEMRQILSIVGVGYDDPASIIALQVPIVDVIEQHDEAKALKHIREYIAFACHEAKELYHRRETAPA